MPLPKPRANEDKDDFVSRCMSNSVMNEDFPGKKQRLAVCFSQWKKKDYNSMETKHATSSFEFKDSEGEGIFEGHAAIFNTPDQYDDIIMPGAFKKSLHKHPKKKVKMLRQHKADSIIGVWEEIKEDPKGLFVKGRLLLELQGAKEAFILMKEGALDSLSIGFRTVVDLFDSKAKTRSLVELALFEISLVAIPAQLGAIITSVKQASPEEITTKTDLENALCNAGFSISTSKYITAGWTPPARRDVEGGQTELVASVLQAAKKIRTSIGN